MTTFYGYKYACKCIQYVYSLNPSFPINAPQFGGDTNEDIMTNYPSKEILVTTARIALFLTLLFSYPVLFHPTRAVLNELCAYFYELCSKGTDVLGIQNPDTDEGLLLNSNLYWRQREKDLMYRKEVVRIQY